MPGALDPVTGIPNTSGAPLMPGDFNRPFGMQHAYHHNGMPYGSNNIDRSRISVRRLPPPPNSSAGRVVILLVPDMSVADPSQAKWVAQLDGNMGYVLQGNQAWLNQTTLTSLLQELNMTLATQEGPFAQVLIGNQRMCCNFARYVVFGLLWFAACAILMNLRFSCGAYDEDCAIPLWLLPVVGFAGPIMLFVSAFRSMRERQHQLLGTFRALTVALQTFAHTWTNRQEHSSLELTYRTGLSDPSYFELTPAAAMAVPAQALYPRG